MPAAESGSTMNAGPDAILAQAVVHHATREGARGEVPHGVVDAHVRALDDRLQDVRRVDGALVGVDTGGEEALLLGGLEDAAVAGRREREDVLGALGELGQRELLGASRVVEAGAPCLQDRGVRVDGLDARLEARVPAADEGQVDGAHGADDVGLREALVLAGRQQPEDGAQQVGPLVLAEHETAHVGAVDGGVHERPLLVGVLRGELGDGVDRVEGVGHDEVVAVLDGGPQVVLERR